MYLFYVLNVDGIECTELKHAYLLNFLIDYKYSYLNGHLIISVHESSKNNGKCKELNQLKFTQN